MTKDWVPNRPPKAIIIGHDPRLQNSDTLAEYALFIDYYFRPEPKQRSEKKKYGLAKSVFDHLEYATNGRVKPEEVYVTNLCNDALQRAPQNKMVLIPEYKAYMGVQKIRSIVLNNLSFEFIIPMSMQVNYWLPKFKLYSSDNDFLKCAEPKEKGVVNKIPFYEPKGSGCFQSICGNIYYSNGRKVIPLLHPKNFPLKGNFTVYQNCYNKLREVFRVMK